ncbi:MAG: reverse transcriptase/maturase family protein [Oscillospiraceae bacterium]|nr:reverse transcriptase/maturase family protein [Oscillospiraceae bacterium]
MTDDTRKDTNENAAKQKKPKKTLGIIAAGFDENDESSSLLERILDSGNLLSAYKRIKKNNEEPGIDGMKVDEIMPFLRDNGRELMASVRSGRYFPTPVRRAQLSKPGGGINRFCVPTVIDRMIQQAALQVLQGVFEPTFSDNCYGFRPGRNAQQAIQKAKTYYDDGFVYVADIDLAKYRDTENHEILIQAVENTIDERIVTDLIRKFLRNGVTESGRISTAYEGTSQCGNLAPLLVNIYLTEFDLMLESKGLNFVRYADVCKIYVQSRGAARRATAGCTRFLEKKLKLKPVGKRKKKEGLLNAGRAIVKPAASALTRKKQSSIEKAK